MTTFEELQTAQKNFEAARTYLNEIENEITILRFLGQDTLHEQDAECHAAANYNYWKALDALVKVDTAYSLQIEKEDREMEGEGDLFALFGHESIGGYESMGGSMNPSPDAIGDTLNLLISTIDGLIDGLDSLEDSKRQHPSNFRNEEAKREEAKRQHPSNFRNEEIKPSATRDFVQKHTYPGLGLLDANPGLAEEWDVSLGHPSDEIVDWVFDQFLDPDREAPPCIDLGFEDPVSRRVSLTERDLMDGDVIEDMSHLTFKNVGMVIEDSMEGIFMVDTFEDHGLVWTGWFAWGDKKPSTPVFPATILRVLKHSK